MTDALPGAALWRQLPEHAQRRIKHAVVRLAREVMELPGLRRVGKPMYRRYFSKPYEHGNLYYGIYRSYEDALLDAERTLSETRLAAIDALASYQNARAQLERLTAPAPEQGN